MNLSDRVSAEIAAAQAKTSLDSEAKKKQLDDAERAEKMLKAIGFSIEPRFEICLSGRVASVVK